MSAYVVFVLILLAMIVLTYSGVLEGLMMFVFVGALPGTDHSLPPGFMFGLILAIIWLSLFTLSKYFFQNRFSRRQ